MSDVGKAIVRTVLEDIRVTDVDELSLKRAERHVNEIFEEVVKSVAVQTAAKIGEMRRNGEVSDDDDDFEDEDDDDYED